MILEFFELAKCKNVNPIFHYIFSTTLINTLKGGKLSAKVAMVQLIYFAKMCFLAFSLVAHLKNKTID